MSASQVSLLDFARDFHSGVERHWQYVSPDSVSFMFTAAEEGDGAEVYRLVRAIESQIRQERLWGIKKWLTFRYKHHPRINKWVHEQLDMRPC
jgi:hypothetical protein